MVLLKPTLEGERTKTCTHCSTIGLGSPVRERTTFYVDKREGYRGECRRCTTAAAARQRARELERDPERTRRRARESTRRSKKRNLNRRLRQQRESVARRKAKDPEGFKRRAAAAQRRYQARTRADEEKRKQVRDRDRMDYRLRKERKEGVRMKTEEASNRAVAGIPLPIGPFLEWLRSLYVEATGREPTEATSTIPDEGWKAVAEKIGVTGRTVYRYRVEYVEAGTVDEAIVDRALCADGRLTLWDLYPEQLDYLPETEQLSLEPAA